MNIATLILIYLAAGLAASRLPFSKVYFAHCHNLVSMVISVCLEGGRNNKIVLHRNGTAQTIGSLTSPFKKALIAYAGYTGATVAAIGLFYLVTRGHYYLVINLFLGLIVVSLGLWVRNLFGVTWGMSLVVLLAVPAFFRYDMVIIHLSICLASVLFTQSIITAIHICKQAFMSRNNPGRKAALVQTKFIPSAILGIALFGQTIYFGFFLVKNFL